MSSMTIQQALQEALKHHQAGRRQEAGALCAQILAAQPDYPDALYLSGVLAFHSGRLDLAATRISRAATLSPSVPHFHRDMARLLHLRKRFEEAADCFGAAAALRPDDNAILTEFADSLQLAGRVEESIPVYQRLLQRLGDSVDLHNNLGGALNSLGRVEEAIASFRAALRIDPNSAPCHCNLADALLREAGGLDESITEARRAIELKPDFAEAHRNLGNALLYSHRYDEAIAAYQAALKIDPNMAECHANLGAAFEQKGDSDAALEFCRRAVRLKPELISAHNNLGNILKDRGAIDQAIAAYRTGVTLDPADPFIHGTMIYAWHFHHDQDLAIATIREQHKLWNHHHAEKLTRQAAPHVNDRNPDRRLRIGYVGADFREHCQSNFTLPLLANHDRGQFEIFCYANVSMPDAMTARLQSQAHQWRSIVGLSHARAAELVRGDCIDILIDLTLHMAGGRLLVFAHKPAPVQATWLGYPSSTGLAAMDWRISDPQLDPPGMNDDFYVEKTIRLPETFWCYDPLTDEPDVNPLPAREGQPFTFGCLNNFCKVNDVTLDLWSRVLKAVPGARLIILSDPGAHRDRTLTTLQGMGVEDPGRVEFVSRRPRLDYLRLYHRIDVALDTFPCNGHTTSLDALWMGVPVVSLVGRMAMARGGLSVATNLGMPNLAVNSAEEYVTTAIDLASDLPRLAEIRTGLRDRMTASPLMDGPRFARNMEVAYRQMWRAWCGA